MIPTRIGRKRVWRESCHFLSCIDIKKYMPILFLYYDDWLTGAFRWPRLTDPALTASIPGKQQLVFLQLNVANCHYLYLNHEHEHNIT